MKKALTTLVGAVLLAIMLAGAAFADVFVHSQIESWTPYPTGAVLVAEDLAGAEGDGVRYEDDFTHTKSFTVNNAVDQIAVRARSGDSSTGDVLLRAGVGGVYAPAQTIPATSKTYAVYVFDVSMPAGTSNVNIRGLDLAGVDRLVVDWVELRGTPPDTTPPNTTITSQNVSGSSATFNFTSNEANSTFQCRLDGAAFASCTSPKTYTNLTNGSHTFNVRAIDAAGNTDPTPASSTFTINVCNGTQIQPGDDLDAIVNGDPSTTATHFCVAQGDYTVDNTAVLKSGDSITGPVGNIINVGPASYGVPTAHIDGVGVDKVLAANGTNGITVEWLEITGGDGRIDPNAPASDCPTSNLPDGAGCPIVGTGIGLAMGSADGSARVNYIYAHNNDAAGISNAKGRILHSHFTRNTMDSAFLGVVGSAVKGITEFEIGFSYVHDEQGNGFWHDHSLSGEGNDPLMSSNPPVTGGGASDGGSWFHDNVSVLNGRWGVRFEFTPRDAMMDEHFTPANAPVWLAEDNRIAQNGSGGMSIRDAQNGLARRNTFGPQTIAGVDYLANAGNKAIVASDSGRPDRTDLWNIDIVDNILKGEDIVGCTLPDTVVFCANNTNTP